MLRSEIRRNQEHCLQQMYAWRQQILPLLCFRIKAMRRVPETNIFLQNNNCTTALSTARCYFEVTDGFPIFLFSRRLFLKISTEIKREDIIQSLMTQKIVIFREISLMNVDYFPYLGLAGNFLNFQLCEIQLSAQCLLGEHGPLRGAYLGHSRTWSLSCFVLLSLTFYIPVFKALDSPSWLLLVAQRNKSPSPYFLCIARWLLTITKTRVWTLVGGQVQNNQLL